MSSQVNRREFFAGAAMCCTVDPAPPASVRVEPGRVVVDLAQAAALRKEQGALRIEDPRILIINIGRGRFAALSQKCSHGGGPMAYDRKKRTVQCACWGHSEFTLDGAILGGPAKRPLPVYRTRIDGDRLEVLL